MPLINNNNPEKTEVNIPIPAEISKAFSREVFLLIKAKIATVNKSVGAMRGKTNSIYNMIYFSTKESKKYINQNLKEYFLNNFETINIFRGNINEIAIIKKK